MEEQQRQLQQQQQQQQNQPAIDQVRIQAALNATKLPDSIKLIPEYAGEKISLLRWINHVESALADLNALNIPILQSWQLAIRSKITGEADRALIASGCNHNWNNIKQSLLEHFGDKRNLQTIMAGMKITMGNKQLSEYYLEATKLSADIGQNVALEATYAGQTHLIMHFANRLVLSAFIDGLNQDIKTFVMAKGPSTLAEAKSIADEYQNALQREKYYEKKQNNNFKQGQFKQKKFQHNNNNNGTQNLQQLPYYPQQKTQNYSYQPVSYQNQNQNQNLNQNHTQKFPSNQQNYSRALEPDVSMRSKRSNVPMSGISYRSNAINNNETEEVDEEQYEEEVEELEDEELNFHLSTQLNRKT